VANQNAKTNQGRSNPVQSDTQEIKKEDWIPFFAEFTQQHRGAHARVEILDSDIGDQVETEDRPFDGISTDVKDGEQAVWITFGSTAEDHFTRGIQKVTSILVRKPVGDAGPAVEIVGDKGRTLLELSRDDAYALPPGPA
jgi:hypothetical protein